MPSNNYNASHSHMPRSAVNDVILQAAKEHGGSFALDLPNSKFIFQNRTPYRMESIVNRIVVPNAEQRLEMDADRAE
jgi:hypothetical protein